MKCFLISQRKEKNAKREVILDIGRILVILHTVFIDLLYAAVKNGFYFMGNSSISRKGVF